MEKKNRYRIIDDLIILGQSFPQELNDGRITCCTAGWSPTRGFIRIYPIPPVSEKLKRWNIISIKIENNPKDWRDESWKICDGKDPLKVLENIKLIGKLNREKQIQLLNELPKQCPCILNEKRMSLGLVEPIILGTKWEKDKLKIEYRCKKDCKLSSKYVNHNEQVLEWGIYEWLRKNPEKKQEVIDNLHLFEKEYQIYFLVGNSYKAPRSFMIISIFRFKQGIEIEK